MIKQEIDPFDEIKFLDDIIEYLEKTEESSWCTDVVKTKGGKNCLFGHIFDFGGGKMMDLFESVVATTYMIYPVNDGEHPNYKQDTPKARCLAYLKDIREGKAKSTIRLFQEYDIDILLEKNGIEQEERERLIDMIGKRVKKTSKEGTEPKPFKSMQKHNTIKSIIIHPQLKIPAFTFEDDDSYVECRRCIIL
jgi:hypothetical protein